MTISTKRPASTPHLPAHAPSNEGPEATSPAHPQTSMKGADARAASGTLDAYAAGERAHRSTLRDAVGGQVARGRGSVELQADDIEHDQAIDEALQRIFKQADAHAQASELDQAYAVFASVMHDWDRSASDRAVAAVRAGLLAYRQRDVSRAEFYQVKAEELDPGRTDTLKLAMYLRSLRSEPKAGLEVIEQLEKKAEKATVELRRFKSSFLLQDTQVEAALASAAEGYALTKADGVSKNERLRMTCLYGHILYKNQKPDEAVTVLKEAIGLEPTDRDAHLHIAEIVCPAFDDPVVRPKVEAKLKEANQAYQAGEYERTRALAHEILELDPGEGLAHKLVVFADDRMKERAADLKAGKPQVLAALDTVEERTKLIGQIEGLAAKAKVTKDGQVRPGRVTDLFPDWPELNQVQRATVAYSVLGYAKLIPALIEEGLQYRFVLPGTSATAVDPYADPRARKAFGRYSWSGRGWAYHTKHFVVSGVETIDAALRGKHNTVTHEFAHVVHFYLHECWKRVTGKSPGPVREGDEHNAKLFAELQRLFEEAKEKKNGQSLLDAYSGNNVWEYFAQGMGAYLHQQDASKLYSRNPHLFERAKRVAAELAAFPEGIPAPNPQPIGQETAKASPFLLDRLRREAKDGLVRKRADRLWLALEPIYDPVLARTLLERGGPEQPKDLPARKARLDAIFLRAGELSRMEQKQLPRNHLRSPERALAAMSGEELLHQTHAELLHIAEGKGRAASLDAQTVPKLQDLFARLSAATKGVQGLERFSERVPAELLDEARRELVRVHQAVAALA